MCDHEAVIENLRSQLAAAEGENAALHAELQRLEGEVWFVLDVLKKAMPRD